MAERVDGSYSILESSDGAGSGFWDPEGGGGGGGGGVGGDIPAPMGARLQVDGGR
jgi:hypothetical protein